MKQPSKTAAVLSWIGMTSFWYASIVMGGVYGNHVALNVFKFLTWFIVVMWSIVILGEHAAAATGQDYAISDRHIPATLSFTCDFGIAVIAAAYGHWFYAALIVYQSLLEQTYFYKPETKETKERTSL